MPLSFHPRLINGPFDDPGLYVPFSFEKRALVFDLGDPGGLSNRDLLKISHAFVTHAHMDHFIGFDALLRLFLGREKILHLFGPEGFLQHVEGKLSGYVWNLVENYYNRFVLQITEVRSDCCLIKKYSCEKRFHNELPAEKIDFNGTLLQEPALTVSAVVLDHQIPCLGLALQERFHVNIKKVALASLGLEVGPWLRDFKTALFEERPADSEFIVASGSNQADARVFLLGELTEQIAAITPGQKIVYITDVVFHDANAEKIIKIAEDADHLFIEAAFLEAERDMAARKYHLTARQAGELAGRAGARQFSLFHFSPRYESDMQAMWQEAYGAYQMFLHRQ